MSISIEVRIYRRGHPMFMAVPGQYTKNRVAAAQPTDRISLGNADSGVLESLTSEASAFLTCWFRMARSSFGREAGREGTGAESFGPKFLGLSDT